MAHLGEILSHPGKRPVLGSRNHGALMSRRASAPTIADL